MTTAGAVAAVGAGRASAGSYDRVVNVREEGADASGQESITPVLREHAADDTLFEFPEGRYRMDEQFRLTDFDNVGFRGYDATIVPGDYYDFEGDPRCFKLGTYEQPGEDLRFEGIDFDFTADDTGVRAIQAQISDGLVVKDVTVHGEHDSGTWGPMLFDVTDSDGRGYVGNVRLPDGGEYSKHCPGSVSTGPIGMLVTRYNEGELRIRDCLVDGFPDNGLYASHGGRVYVIGGEYRNSNVANIRLGGDESLITGARVVVDRNRADDVNQTGIRLDRGEYLRVRNTTVDLQEPNGPGIKVLSGAESARISDVDVTVDEGPYAGIDVRSGAGPTGIVDSDIQMEASAYAVNLRPKSSGGGDVTVERVSVTGDADGDRNRFAILCNRDGSEFRAVDVDQPGSTWRRCILLDADDCLVYKGEYRSTHHPIVNEGSHNSIVEVEHAEAYNGSEALLLHDNTRDVEVIRNTLAEGYRDYGTSDLTMYGNEFPS